MCLFVCLVWFVFFWRPQKPVSYLYYKPTSYFKRMQLCLDQDVQLRHSSSFTLNCSTKERLRERRREGEAEWMGWGRGRQGFDECCDSPRKKCKNRWKEREVPWIVREWVRERERGGELRSYYTTQNFVTQIRTQNDWDFRHLPIVTICPCLSTCRYTQDKSKSYHNDDDDDNDNILMTMLIYWWQH